MNHLVAGNGSYIVRLSVRDLHGPTRITIGTEVRVLLNVLSADFIRLTIKKLVSIINV